MNWAEEEGGWEKVVRPMVVETIAWAETQFGKPQTAGNKWVIFGELKPPIRRVIKTLGVTIELYSSSLVRY